MVGASRDGGKRTGFAVTCQVGPAVVAGTGCLGTKTNVQVSVAAATRNLKFEVSGPLRDLD